MSVKQKSLSDFMIVNRWPAQNPELLQLYSYPTPNGVKISIMLEEIGLPYEAHRIALNADGVTTPEFLSLNPNNKIPAIIDPNGPNGEPLALFESGAILIYLAEKTGQLIGQTPQERMTVLQWLMFQMGGIGPMFGQLGYFHAFAGKEIEDPRPKQRYINETTRLLKVVNKQLDGQDWIAGDYSIADIAIAPWIVAIDRFYNAGDLVGLPDCPNVVKYIDRFYVRPAVQKGMTIPEE